MYLPLKKSRAAFFLALAFPLLGVHGCGGGSGGGASPTTSTSPAQEQLQGLSVSPQADGAVYATGSYQGSPVRFTHQGAVGNGQWALYTGADNDRTRVTFTDKGGLQEILSMDKGHRTTVNYIGSERIEYRTYSAAGRFSIGSVLYQSDGKWLQGWMFTEAFSGYGNLVLVQDVTSKVSQNDGSLD